MAHLKGFRHHRGRPNSDRLCLFGDSGARLQELGVPNGHRLRVSILLLLVAGLTANTFFALQTLSFLLRPWSDPRHNRPLHPTRQTILSQPLFPRSPYSIHLLYNHLPYPHAPHLPQNPYRPRPGRYASPSLRL